MEKGSCFVRKTKIFLGCIILLGAIIYLVPTRIVAQTIGVQLFRIFATRSNGLPIAIPTPYLNYTHITTVSTVVPKTSVGILGCVIIGTAGAAGSTVKIYNGPSALAINEMANIDGTLAGREFCYGIIFNHGGGFAINVASGGAVPDVVVTWR